MNILKRATFSANKCKRLFKPKRSSVTVKRLNNYSSDTTLVFLYVFIKDKYRHF